MEVAGLPSCVHLVLTGISGEGTLIGASKDASYLYYVGNSNNLYVDHNDGSGWTQTPIVTLSGDDHPDWEAALKRRTSRVSPNGEWLAFMSDEPLTGYDNRDARSGKPDEEVFLYGGDSGRVVCASCDPTGARPVGVEYKSESLTGGKGVWGGQWLAANVPGWTPYELDGARYQSRYLSDDGRLFFNSSDALVSQDTNGNWDVYEYEPVGMGSCRVSDPTFNAGSGGCSGLISSGVGFGESAFLDASGTGGDVFFLTAERLLPKKDVDTSLDVYDAHECTAVSPCPASEVPVPPECVSASACRAAPLAQPSLFGAPSSQTFAGVGNLAPVTIPPPRPPALTWKQKLAKALKACRKDKSKRRRVTCEHTARKRYVPAKPAVRAGVVKRRRQGGR